MADGRLTPDFKTIADFRKDNGPAIRSACRQFVALCGGLNLFTQTIVAIDGSQFKHEAVLDAMQERLDRAPGSMRMTPDRGTSVCDHQGLDGRDPFPPAHA